MRDGANLAADLFYQRGIFGNRSGSRLIELMGLLLHHGDVHDECREQLPRAVVQLTCNLPPLFIAHLLQPIRQFTQAFVRRVQVCRSFPDLLLEIVMAFGSCSSVHLLLARVRRFASPRGTERCGLPRRLGLRIQAIAF
jgi:hypothetical protein